MLNPKVEGTVQKIVTASNSGRASKKLYHNLAAYFTNHMNRFNMTVHNLETKQNTHFLVEEEKDDDDKVNFKITRLEGTFPKDVEDAIIEAATSESVKKQKGGKKKKKDCSSDSDSDSSSSSDDEYYARPRYNMPISTYTYYNLPYVTLYPAELVTVNYAVSSIPMFNLPINPTVDTITFTNIPWTFY